MISFKKLLGPFLLTLITVASCKKALIEGKIVDAFGQSVKEVLVTIDGTSFSDHTNAKGTYSIEYVPGIVHVKFHKEGYTDTSFTTNIATESKYPAQQLPIYAIPKVEAVYALGTNSYIDLKEASVNKIHTPARSFGYPSSDVYTVTIMDSNCTTIKKSNALTFIDHSPKPIILLKLLKYHAHQYAVLERQGNNCTLGFMMGDYQDGGTVLTENTLTPDQSQHVTLRTPTLPLDTGYYAFAVYRNKADPPLEDKVFVFKIQAENTAH